MRSSGLMGGMNGKLAVTYCRVVNRAAQRLSGATRVLVQGGAQVLLLCANTGQVIPIGATTVARFGEGGVSIEVLLTVDRYAAAPVGAVLCAAQ